jgi:acyl-CoA synthetase (AMP-forming)/AMP-acid ligase II
VPVPGPWLYRPRVPLPQSEDGHGRQVPADAQTVGEIMVRGNAVMEGYYHDPEATDRVMAGGRFHTGDAAVVHPDGYVEIRDRLKDVIISGGENISSIEVEGVLLRHRGEWPVPD